MRRIFYLILTTLLTISVQQFAFANGSEASSGELGPKNTECSAINQSSKMKENLSNDENSPNENSGKETAEK